MRKRFGQHFLVDSFVIDGLIDLIDPGPGSPIFEIGPGEGVLTAPLLEAGAEVSAVEIDHELAAGLIRRFSALPNFKLYTGDILKFDFTTLGDPSQRWQVAGNLPYNISTPLIMRLLDETGRFSRMTLMVQKEVAERLAAAPGSKAYGRLSVMTQRKCAVSIHMEIGPDSFSPPPKVDSSVVVLHPHMETVDAGLERWLAEIVRSAFSARRKTLANALRRQVDAAGFARAGIDPTIRAEQLAVEDFARLAQATRRPDVTHNFCG